MVMSIATSYVIDAEESSAKPMFVVNQCLQATTCWILILGITGVSERLFTRANPVVRYMVDASYWIYLMHLPLTIFIPALFRGWNVWGIVKMPVMIVLVTVLLLVVYWIWDTIVVRRETPLDAALDDGRRALYFAASNGHDSKSHRRCQRARSCARRCGARGRRASRSCLRATASTSTR